jgi:predicted nucleic acid-binding protein
VAELVFVDTSAFYALADSGDAHHDHAVSAARMLSEGGGRPFTSNYVVAETHVLVLSRLGHRAARKWLRELSLHVEQVIEADQEAARALVLAEDGRDYSLTDASSFCVMRRLGVSTAFSYDKHFAGAGFACVGRAGA